MPQELADRLARLNELTDEELAQLEADLIKYFDSLDEGERSEQSVALMGEAAEGIDRVRETQTSREESRVQAEAQAEQLRSRVHKAEADEDTDGGADDDEDTEEVTPAEEVPDTAKDPSKTRQVEVEDQAPAAVAASNRPSLSAVARRRPTASAPRQSESALKAGGRVRAMANAGAIKVGDELTGFDQVTQAMVERIRSLGRGSGERFTVARVELDYPDERRLGSDINENSRKIDAALDTAALVASGGICNPVDVDYSIMVVSDDDEPIADGLPSFQATRGGLRFIQPPTFASVGASGTAIWTEANDVNPTSPSTKPVQTINCGTEVEVYVDAIPTRLKFGNMMGRFSPEIVEANTKLALANAARVREVNRLNTIASHSISVSSGQLLGAARDLLATMDQVAAAYRYRHRIKRNGVQIRVIFPDWARDMVRADLTRELAHGDDTNLALTDAQVDQLLQSRGFAPIWTLDSQGAGQTGTNDGGGSGLVYPAQTWGAQGQGAILDWPHTLVWYMFAEGTFQRLDGGTLDLGVVRDATLDSTNDYETFVEVFEGIAKRGFESLQVLSVVRPNGASAATKDTTTY